MLFIFDLMKIVVKVKNITLFLGTSVLIIGSAYLIHFLEPEEFETPFIGFWWVMTTVTTTGFGDFVPGTTAGRILALFLYIAGISLIGVIIGKMVQSISLYQRMKEEGRLKFKGRQHFIVIGWSQKASKTINEILLAKPDSKIVIIDLLPKAPLIREEVHYIQGDATERDILLKANICESDSVLIFAPDSIHDPMSIDGRSLLIASTIESLAAELNDDIYTIVEIIREKHIPNFKHAMVDEFVLSNEAFSDLMAKSALHKGSTKLFMQLLSREHGDNVWEVNRKPEWSTYNDAYEGFKELGANLISDRKDFGIVRKLDETIPEEARLYVICDEDTYRKIKMNM
ncbi:potassium channel family protein [Bacillus sp. FJAT-45350]|uniref:potassium channel family protein n=1 Tax=Bacillus sp. FJAT-45350 TaxID=2011014 RepID=UPI000BB7FAA5|nr:potassium channel family protein [Bacillus sp. FJAT-45350]